MKTDSTPGLVVAIGDRPDGKQGDGNLDAMSSASNVDTVPLDMLAMPDDQEQLQPPEVGDEVNYQVTGKVVAIEGDQAKVQRTSINGQDIPGSDNDDESQTPQDADANAAQGLRDQAGGMGTMLSILIFFLLLWNTPVRAQNAAMEGTFLNGNVGVYPTNYFVFPNQPSRLYRVLGYNQSNAPVCVQFFQTNALPPNGAAPLFVIPTAALATYQLDFGTVGCQIDSGVICASSTTNTLTLCPTACITVISIESQR